MTHGPPPREANEVALERERAHVEKTRRFLNRLIWVLAAAFVGMAAVLAGTMLNSYRTAQREAAIFASVSAAAFGQGFCDRALRLAVAGLPPDRRPLAAFVSAATVAGRFVVFCLRS